MNLLEAKIYYDGSNWIAIPHTERPYRQKRQRAKIEKSEELQQFEERFEKVKGKRKNRKAELLQEFTPMFRAEDEAVHFVEQHFERLSRNRWERYKRMIRRGYTNRWNFFCTYTFDTRKQTEESFRKTLMNTLYHLSSRGRMGTRGVGTAAAFPCAYLHSGRPNARRVRGTRRLQHQASQAGKERTEQLLQRAVRKKRFLGCQ